MVSSGSPSEKIILNPHTEEKNILIYSPLRLFLFKKGKTVKKNKNAVYNSKKE
jgi:hypothetical protein